MRRIGLIGGLSWHSTATYYRIINEQVAAERGGHASAEICLQSIDFDEVASAVTIPAVYIADAVAEVALANGWRTLGLLGARWVMEETFYAERLASHGIEVVIPDPAQRAEVDRVIFDEITQGTFLPSSRESYCQIIGELGASGAGAEALACTGIGLLVGAEDSPLTFIDSATTHATARVTAAMAE